MYALFGKRFGHIEYLGRYHTLELALRVYDDFLSNIVSDNAEKTSKIATYVNKIVKDSYEKGKKDAMKDGLGNMGKGGKSSTGNSDVGALGKELAQRNVVNKSDFDYFKSN